MRRLRGAPKRFSSVHWRFQGARSGLGAFLDSSEAFRNALGAGLKPFWVPPRRSAALLGIFEALWGAWKKSSEDCRGGPGAFVHGFCDRQRRGNAAFSSCFTQFSEAFEEAAKSNENQPLGAFFGSSEAIRSGLGAALRPFWVPPRRSAALSGVSGVL